MPHKQCKIIIFSCTQQRWFFFSFLQMNPVLTIPALAFYLPNLTLFFGTGLADCAYRCWPGSPLSADHSILAGTQGVCYGPDLYRSRHTCLFLLLLLEQNKGCMRRMLWLVSRVQNVFWDISRLTKLQFSLHYWTNLNRPYALFAAKDVTISSVGNKCVPAQSYI